MKNVETIYPLSPMQAGMLYETLYAPGSGAYIGQVSFRLRGAFDLDAFRRAWQLLINRHAALRTLFLWQGVSAPVQVVRREAELPCESLDWSGLDAAEQEARLREYLESDRARGFELTRAPLLRLTIIALGEGATHFIWSYHHLVIDGWSVSILLGELAACFHAFARGAQTPPALLAPARPYRDYIVWLQRQDASEAERFWRNELEGASMPTPVPARPAADGAPVRERRRQVKLTHEEFSALKAYAQRHRLTVNTVAQAAWGLLVGHLAGRADVVFGATVSGRPPEPGVDTMIGMFINTLPVRFSARETDALAACLQSLQARQVESRRFEYCSLTQIQSWCGVARGVRLYDSLLAFHNYPGQQSGAATLTLGGTTSLGDLRAVSQVAYPLEMEIMPAPGATELTLRYDSERVEEATAERVLEGFAALLRGAAETTEAATVGDWLARLRAEDKRRQESKEDAFEQAAAQKLKGLKGLRGRTRAGSNGAATTTTKG